MTHTLARNVLRSLATLGLFVGATTVLTGSTADAASPWSGVLETFIVNTAKAPVPVQDVVLPLPFNDAGSFSVDVGGPPIFNYTIPRPSVFAVSVVHLEELEVSMFGATAPPSCLLMFPGTVTSVVEYDLDFEPRGGGRYVARLGTRLTLAAGTQLTFWCAQFEDGVASFALAGRHEGFRDTGP